MGAIEQQPTQDAAIENTLDTESPIQVPADQPAVLRLNESFAEFTALSYTPTFDRLVREKMANYDGQATSFADGGSRDGFGRNAMRALLVPPFALMFSLLGGILHIGKLSACVSRFLPGHRGLKLVLIFGALAFAILAVFWRPNPVSTSRVFASFQQQMAASRGWPLERALTWVVQAQPYFYPVNEAIRRSLPGDVTYGYEPHEPNDRPVQTPANQMHIVAGSR